MSWQDEKLREMFDDAEYVEVYGEKMLFDSKACDRWNTIWWWVSTILFILTVTKAY